MLPITFYSAADTTLSINTNNVLPLADNVYVPTIVPGKNKFTLLTTGPNGIKADRKDLQTASQYSLTDLAVMKSNNKDINFLIKTLEMNKGSQEFYFPKLAGSTNSSTNLDFVMIPVNGTDLEIAPNGTITLNSSKGIYSMQGYTLLNFKSMIDACKPTITNSVPANSVGAGFITP